MNGSSEEVSVSRRKVLPSQAVPQMPVCKSRAGDGRRHRSAIKLRHMWQCNEAVTDNFRARSALRYLFGCRKTLLLHSAWFSSRTQWLLAWLVKKLKEAAAEGAGKERKKRFSWRKKQADLLWMNFFIVSPLEADVRNANQVIHFLVQEADKEVNTSPTFIFCVKEGWPHL